MKSRRIARRALDFLVFGSGWLLIILPVTLALLLLSASGCASTPTPTPTPLPPIIIPADCDDAPVVTSTPTNNGGACAAIREAWAIQRDTAVRWRGIASKRKETIDQLEQNLTDTRDELARAHVRLVESPPPAPDRGSALLGILLPFGGAALGGGGAALACSEAGCSTAGTALASAGAAGLLAALGAWLAGLSP